MGQLQLLWPASASANLSQTVGMGAKRLLGWQDVREAGRMDGSMPCAEAALSLTPCLQPLSMVLILLLLA